MTEKDKKLFKPGKPEKPLDWIKILKEREEKIKYLKNAERYWYGEGFGSEKRKNPA
ncbi:MAG: hypothetical protein NC906_02390 [Candidatus Omnitrophica bacterium]|nr:hypothetical protein [Candidatus Omnitrophota bacterium]